jgi:hypothetical protein
MKIANSAIVVTVPQKFLDSAVYPVVVDPTFGYTTEGSSSFGLGADIASACKFSLTEAGNITKISAYTRRNVAGDKYCKTLIYSDVAGAPTTLLATSDAVLIVSVGWYDFTISYSASAGTYWLVMITDTGIDVYYDAGGVNQSCWKTVFTYASPANPFGAPSGYADRNTSIHADYTATSTGQQLFTLINEMGY